MQNEAAIPLATRAPPLPLWKTIPRTWWIGGAVGLGLVVLLLCAGAGVLVQSSSGIVEPGFV